MSIKKFSMELGNHYVIAEVVMQDGELVKVVGAFNDDGSEVWVAESSAFNEVAEQMAIRHTKAVFDTFLTETLEGE